MRIARVHYAGRDEMVQGIRRMAAEGWVVRAVTTLPENSYIVEFTRRPNRESGENYEESDCGNDSGSFGRLVAGGPAHIRAVGIPRSLALEC